MRTVLLAGGLVGAVLLNVATVTSSAVAAVVSGMVETVTGVASVKTRLEREVTTTRGKLTETASQAKALEAEVAKKSKLVQSLEGEALQKSNKVKALEAEVERLKPKLVTYRGQKKLLGEAVTDTTQRVAKRTVAGATRNVASTFGEAVPMVGIAVVVGATAWEIKDACDTMKDLHELDVAIDPSKAKAEGVSEVCGLKVPSKAELWEKVMGDK